MRSNIRRAWSSFNPTLVRLRRPQTAEAWRKAILFQSHAGSIEASALTPHALDTAPVSIPRWFD